MASNGRNSSQLLTERECEVVRLLSLGCTIYEAGAILGLAGSTIDNHKVRAMAKLKVTKMAMLTRAAILTGISSLRDQLTPTEKRRLRKWQSLWKR